MGKTVGTILTVVAIAVAVIFQQYYLAGALAVSLAGSLLLQPTLPRPNDQKIVTKQARPDRVRGYGRARLGGAYMLREVSDGTLYSVVGLHHTEVDAIEKIWLHDEEVTVSANVVSNPTHFSGNARIYTKLGTIPETAFSALISEIPDLIAADHRGDGIAQILVAASTVKAKNWTKTYPFGPPIPTALLRMSKVFDPRDGGQSHDAPGSWVWSANPVLALADFLTHQDGMRMDYARRILPALDQWIEEASACDEAVPLKAGGTEPRYEFHGVYRLRDRPADVVVGICAVMDGWLYMRPDGAVGVRAGRYVAPMVTIHGKHIVGAEIRQNRRKDEIVNEIRASYCSPPHAYAEVEAPPLQDAGSVADIGLQSQEIDLTRVQNFGQVRRLMKRALYRLRGAVTGTIVVDAYGLVARGERYLAIDLSALGFGVRTVEVTAYRITLQPLGATIEWQDVGPEIDAWDPATEEGDPVPPPPVDDPDARVSVAVPTGLAVSGMTVDVGAGSTGLRIQATWNEDPTKGYELRFRRLLVDEEWGPWTEEDVNDQNASAAVVTHWTALVDDGETYEVAVRAVDGSERRSDWSAAETITVHAEVTAPYYLVTEPGDALVDESGAYLVTD